MTFDDFFAQWHDSGDTIAAHTSGSTGEPKDILLSKEDMRASARRTNQFFGLTRGAVFLCPLSPDYIAAKMMAVRADICGGKLVAPAPSNNFDIPEGDVDLLAIVPSQTDRLLRDPRLAKRIHNIIIGGAELPANRRKALADAGFNAFETYGMTETCSHVALKHITDECFKALPGVGFTTDGRGCLVIDVPYFSQTRYQTNDVVKLIDDSTFVWLGRHDNVINSGGVKIHAEILEKKIREILPGLPEFMITSRKHDKWGQCVLMVVEGTEVNTEEIEASLRSRLHGPEMPSQIIAVEALPRTSSGKIRRVFGM